MLFLKELKYNSLIYIIFSSILFIFAFFFRVHNDISNIKTLFEITNPLIFILLSAFILYNNWDLSLLLTQKKSIFKIVINRFLASAFIFVSLNIIQAAILIAFSIYIFKIIFSFLLLILLISSLILLLTVIFKNSYIGLTISAITIPFLLASGFYLFNSKLPSWYQVLSFYDSVFIYGSPYWLSKQVIICSVLIAVWILIYFLLSDPSRNIIINENVT